MFDDIFVVISQTIQLFSYLRPYKDVAEIDPNVLPSILQDTYIWIHFKSTE